MHILPYLVPAFALLVSSNSRSARRQQKDRANSDRQAASLAENQATRARDEEQLVNVRLREQQRIYRHNRRILLDGQGEITPEQWLTLCNKYSNLCVRCGADLPLTMDHITPVSRGGRNVIENIQPLCKYCNSSKGTDDTDYRPF